VSRFIKRGYRLYQERDYRKNKIALCIGFLFRQMSNMLRQFEIIYAEKFIQLTLHKMHKPSGLSDCWEVGLGLWVIVWTSVLKAIAEVPIQGYILRCLLHRRRQLHTIQYDSQLPVTLRAHHLSE
jgi:hypothetical protein